MTSFLSVKGASSQAGNPASSQGKGFPRGVKLCEFVSSCRQAGGRECCGSRTSSSRQLYQVESAVGFGRPNSRRRSGFETSCHLATDREPLQEEVVSLEGELLSPQENRKPLRSRLSHFLRELAKQDVWAGLLDPFQTAGGSSNDVNYFTQELKMRYSSSPSSPSTDSTTPDVNSQNSNSSPTILLDDEWTPLSPRVSCYPGTEGMPRSGTRIDVTSVSSATDLLSYATDAATGVACANGVYPGRDGQGGSLSISTPLINSENLVTVMEAAGQLTAGHALIEVPQAELCQKSATCVTAADLGSVDNLARWLEERIGSNIISQWGVAPGTKFVSNLWCELVEGEISLEDSIPPKRSTHVTSVKIKNKEGHVLVEAYQEMADGRKRPRNRPLSEKMRPGEKVEEACLRGIFEELGSQMGARERVMMIPVSYRREEEERESFSYPGLPTRYVIHSMEAHIQQLPTTEFSTEEDESGHGGSSAGVAALKGSGSQEKAVGVKRHFWRWIPENRLAELCKR